MTLVKVTVKTSNRIYVSVDIPGYGFNNTNFNVAKVTLQLLPDNFPSFNGTVEEWDDIKRHAIQIKFENIGHI